MLSTVHKGVDDPKILHLKKPEFHMGNINLITQRHCGEEIAFNLWLRKIESSQARAR
jgi:hypothetical protein